MLDTSLNILHTESSCGWGGQEIRILTESQGMMKRGHKVTILCCPHSNIYREAQARGIAVVGLPIEKKRFSALTALTGWLKQYGCAFDVINTHSSTDAWLVGVAGLILGKRLPPMVRTRHVSTDINQSFTTRWLYLKATRHIATTGERLRQQLHRDNRYPLTHMTSVPTGIDLDFYRQHSRQNARQTIGIPERPTLGILATMRSWKGHAYLLDAWQTLSKDFPDWQLLMVGDGPQRSALEQQVASMGLSDNVLFLGNRDDVPDCLNSMDVFVLPSYGNEGVPQSIMQAMACGLPVVSTTVGAIDEAVVSGETGYLIAPKDAVQLASTLRQLMGDDALRVRFGQAALQRAATCFGADIMLDRMTTIFQNSLRTRNQ
ncbi:glycosyltransferase family 4 protein [Musicola paradisiaca]|uniref:Glycosyl transferase group 1 n=1 Tax=Musicola paradisiaca (strain Ech703) TaxID=579405 RepID=C6C6R5_MUSP7|nr:glycosyltransferase family 4 protein [Musicola paradisiaca]ACS83984.1 glycosyl transferase group 1 [Musicola paradisiaca Ech703]